MVELTSVKKTNIDIPTSLRLGRPKEITLFKRERDLLTNLLGQIDTKSLNGNQEDALNHLRERLL